MPTLSEHPLLSLRGVTKAFGGHKVLRGVDLDVNETEIVGIFGPNGAGKTSLINVIFGVYRRDSGEVLVKGSRILSSSTALVKAGVARTFQNVRLPEDMSVREVLRSVLVARCSNWPNLLRLGMLPGHIREKEDELLAWFGLLDQANRRAGRLPFAIQRRVDIARAVATGAQLLCLDEPAAGLSACEEGELSAALTRLRVERGISLLVIDHRVDFLRKLVDRFIFLCDGQVQAEGLAHGEDAIFDHHVVRDSYLGVTPVSNVPDRPRNHPESREEALNLSGLTVHRGVVPAVRNVTFNVRQGSWTAIVGPNGAGKTTLLEAILGLHPIKSGTLSAPGAGGAGNVRTRIALVPSAPDLFPGLTVRQNLRLGALGRARAAWSSAVREVCTSLPGLSTLLDREAETLSGGERKIVLLARGLISKPGILLVDEATAGLSPIWANRIYASLRKLAGVVTVISAEQSDEHVVDSADRVIRMAGGVIGDNLVGTLMETSVIHVAKGAEHGHSI